MAEHCMCCSYESKCPGLDTGNAERVAELEREIAELRALSRAVDHRPMTERSVNNFAQIYERFRAGAFSVDDILANRVPGLALSEYERSALVAQLLDIERCSRPLSAEELETFTASAERAGLLFMALRARLQTVGRAITSELPRPLRLLARSWLRVW